MPESEKSESIITNASFGFDSESPMYSRMSSRPVAPATIAATPNAARQETR